MFTPKLAGLLALVALQVPLTMAGAPNFAACSENFYKGFAPTPSQAQPGQQRALCFDSFAVLHSGQSKTPVYVAEYLTPARLADAGDETRTNRFYEEARLPSADRATLADYAGSGFDRGHMAPAADMPNPNAMAQSFSLANMVPQAPANNRGPWAKSVEKVTRAYAMRSAQGVYVLTGPIYSGQVTTIGTGKVWVPSYLFKLVYDPAKKRAWAHVLPNRDDAKAEGTYSYQDLVKMTGVQWLPAGAVN